MTETESVKPTRTRTRERRAREEGREGGEIKLKLRGSMSK